MRPHVAIQQSIKRIAKLILTRAFPTSTLRLAIFPIHNLSITN